MDPGLNSISLVLSTGAREESILPLPQPPPPPHGPRPPGRRLHSPQVTTRKVRHQAASGWLFITPSPRPLSLSLDLAAAAAAVRWAVSRVSTH